MVIFVTGIFLNYYIKLHRSNYVWFFKTNPQNKAQQRCSAPSDTLLRGLPVPPQPGLTPAPSSPLGLELETKPPPLHLLWTGVQTQRRSQAAPGTRPGTQRAAAAPAPRPRCCAGSRTAPRDEPSRELGWQRSGPSCTNAAMPERFPRKG